MQSYDYNVMGDNAIGLHEDDTRQRQNNIARADSGAKSIEMGVRSGKGSTERAYNGSNTEYKLIDID